MNQTTNKDFAFGFLFLVVIVALILIYFRLSQISSKADSVCKFSNAEVKEDSNISEDDLVEGSEEENAELE